MSDSAKDRKTGLGRRLAVLREALGLEQKDVSQRARVAAGAVSQIEQGRREPEPDTRDRLLEALRGSPTNVQRAAWLIRAVTGETEAEAAGRAIEDLGFTVEDQARARIAQRTGAARLAERREALHDWADLRSFDVEELRKIIEDCPELQTSAFWEVLCEESAKVARTATQKAIDLARLALDLAGWMPLVDESQRPAYQGMALAFVANAVRVQGQLPSAEKAFEQSDALWQAGSPVGPDLDGTRLLDLRASLLFDQRHLSDALDLLDRGLEMGPRGHAARARILIQKAKIYEELEQHAMALKLLEQADPLLVREPEPVLVHIQRTNIVVNLLALGQVEEAERRLGEVQALAEELGNDLDKLRLCWLEARLDAALGRRLAAIDKMRKVRAGFQERKIPFDTGLATLELSALLLEQGETAEVKELAAEMLKTFAEQEVPQEAEMALRIFCEAAIQETATVELVRRALGEMAHLAGPEPRAHPGNT
jgi:transcriptional regulator with XRE-family HTH domain